VTDTQGDDNGAGARQVTRTIHVPKSVSAQAQQFLAMTSQLGVDNPALSPSDLEGWRSMIKASDDGLIAILGPQVTDLPFTVEERVTAGVPMFVLTPDDLVHDAESPIYVNIHGGGLIMGGGEACRIMSLKTAEMTHMTTWSVDYRMPPDHPYPAALDDCLAVYRELLTTRPPERIVVGGGSAGANLAAALVLRSRDEGLPLPAALVLMTPEADLTESGDTFQTNLGIDSVLTSSLADSIKLYAGNHDLRHPYLSPLFGDLTSPFPPTFLQSGTRDLFLSNTVRMHRRLRAGGVDAELHVFEAMPHGGFFGAPEDDEMAAEVRKFLTAKLVN
jgi:epsilon-lactone hydrolase